MPFGKCKHLHHAKLQSWSNVFLKRGKHKRFGFMTLQCKKKPDCAKPIDIKMIEARARVMGVTKTKTLEN